MTSHCQVLPVLLGVMAVSGWLGKMKVERSLRGSMDLSETWRREDEERFRQTSARVSQRDAAIRTIDKDKNDVVRLRIGFE